MKKLAVLPLILCLCLPGAWAEAALEPDEQGLGDLSRAIYDANQLDALYSRYPSLEFFIRYPDDPDRNLLMWQTPEGIYDEYGAQLSEYIRDRLFYRMTFDAQTGEARLMCGAVIDPDYDPIYCMVGDSFEHFYDAEHEHPAGVREQDGRLCLRTEYDEKGSREIIEGLGFEYTGQTLATELTVDRESLEILELTKIALQDGEEKLLEDVTVQYGTPQPFAMRNLLAAFDYVGPGKVTQTFVVDPGTDRAFVRSVTVPPGVDCQFIDGQLPFLVFGDENGETLLDWDMTSDATWYVFTNPDDDLTEKFNALSEARSEAMGREIMAGLYDANTREAILARHDSLSAAFELPFGEDFALYSDRDNRYFTSNANHRSLYFDGEFWEIENPGGRDEAVACWFYAMDRAEADAMMAADNASPILAETTLTERPTDLFDNGDGTHTLVTQLSAEDLAAQMAAEGVESPQDIMGLPAEVAYALDPTTGEILRQTGAAVRGDERVDIFTVNCAYDAPLPAEMEEMLALREALTGVDDDRAVTFTVVYGAGTDAEQRYALRVDRDAGVRFHAVLREGYQEVSRETTENGDITLCAAPAEE